MFVFNFPAEIRAGSLVAGVVPMLRVLQLTVISEADVITFAAHIMPVAPTLARWWTIERSSGFSEHKKGDHGVQFGITFRKRLANFGAKSVFLSCLFPGNVF